MIWFDGLPFRIRTTNMAGALTNIGYHISEKEVKRGKKLAFFILKPASQACRLAWILELDLRLRIKESINICLFFERQSEEKLNEAHFPPHFWVSLIVLPSHCKTV